MQSFVVGGRHDGSLFYVVAVAMTDENGSFVGCGWRRWRAQVALLNDMMTLRQLWNGSCGINNEKENTRNEGKRVELQCSSFSLRARLVAVFVASLPDDGLMPVTLAACIIASLMARRSQEESVCFSKRQLFSYLSRGAGRHLQTELVKKYQVSTHHHLGNRSFTF